MYPQIDIKEEELYENDQVMNCIFDSKDWKNFQARLRRRGFKLSLNHEAYYHPKHWRLLRGNSKSLINCMWFHDDTFCALTKEARKTLD